MFSLSHIRRQLACVASLLAAMAAASCSQPTTSTSTVGSSTEDDASANYGNPSEIALLGVVHRKFPANAIFSEEIISDVSGEKHVCGHVAFDDRSTKYVFSLNQGLYTDPRAETWRGNCANGWKPGSGF